MAGRDNVTFSFRIDSARASAAIKELTQALERLNATNVKVDKNLKNTQRQITNTGTNAAASAVNFQTATQGMLNLSTAAVQTFTSISNLDRAQNRAKMSIIAVARAEDLLNNKRQRLKEMTEAGITSGGKYANMQREIATAEADLTVKIEKKGIEQGAVNDIYMLFATNIANVTISSMQTLAILDKNDIMLKKARVVAQKISNASIFTGAKAAYSNSIATALQGKAAVVTGAATAGLTLKVKALTVAMKGFMASNPVLLAAMVASTAAFAIHESNILGTKDALDELMGVEKDFESQVKGARDGIEDFDDSLGGLNSTVGSSLPNSFESATKVMIAFNNALRDTKESAQQAEVAVNNFYTSKAGGRGGSLEVTNRPPPPPQVNQDLRNKKPGRHFSTPSGGGQNEALANALSATGAFLMADPFAGSYAHADRGDNSGRELIAIEEKAQVESRRGKISTPSAIAAAAQPTPESFQGDQGSIFKEGPDMNQQFQLGNASGGMTNIPSVKEMAVTMGMSEESLSQALKDGQIDIKQLQIANQILNGDLMTIKHVADFVELTKFKQFTPELESDRLALEKAKEQDKNFAEIFRERYMGTGVSIDKTLLQLGKLEPDRKKRFESKNLTYIDGVGFDLSTERGLEEHQKFMQAKLGQLIPTVDPLDFAGIKDKQKELTGKQYLRFLAGNGLNDPSSFLNNRYIGRGTQNSKLLATTGFGFGQPTEAFGQIIHNMGSTSNIILNKNQNRLLAKIQNGEISGNRAEVLLELGIDIGNAANNYSIEEAMRIGALQTQAAGFQGLGGNATAAYQVPRGSIRASDEFYARIRIKDANTNRLRWGGTRVPGMEMDEEGAVVGGYSSAREFRRASKSAGQARLASSLHFLESLGLGGYAASGPFLKSNYRSNYVRLPTIAQGIQEEIAASGLSLAKLGLREYYGGATRQIGDIKYNKHKSQAVQHNQSVLARARAINVLAGGFGLNQYVGSQLGLSQFEEKITEQTRLATSIGLSRTEVFQIVDTEGRGREEIDDRLAWKSRLSSVSTGTSVL